MTADGWSDVEREEGTLTAVEKHDNGWYSVTSRRDRAAAVLEAFGADPARTLKEQDLDSLELAALVIDLETEFRTAIPESVSAEWKTVEDILAWADAR